MIQRFLDKVDLGLDFITLGQWGLETAPGKYPSLAHYSNDELDDQIDVLCSDALSGGLTEDLRLQHARLVEERHERRKR